MLCPHCGKDNESGAQRCSQCGRELTGKNADAAPETNSPMHEYRPADVPPGVQLTPKRSPLGKFLSACAHAVFYVMLFVGCQSVVVSGYLTAVMAGNPAAYAETDAMLALTEKVNEKTVLILLISNLLTILLACLFMHIRHRDPMQEMELWPVNPFRFGTFAVFGMAMNVFVSVTLSMIPLPESVIEQFNTQTAPLYGEMHPLLEILSVAVIAGITEELIFRGLVISRLRRGMGMTAAVVISSVIFGAAHGSLIAVAYATLLGLLLGGLYARYNSVVPGIIFHVFFNMTSYWLPTEGVVLIVLYAASVVLIALGVWRIFVRYPVFNDIFTDIRGLIKPVNDEEAAIIAEIKRHQKNGRITADELEELNDRWAENRKNLRRDRKSGKRK
ncbi:MAG: CPBP family intramembrane metalloprotease [Clostridia bacterium]|nr:CPBP family intramembrane metalloprotease [Clostridia bacterium]